MGRGREGEGREGSEGGDSEWVEQRESNGTSTSNIKAMMQTTSHWICVQHVYCHCYNSVCPNIP